MKPEDLPPHILRLIRGVRKITVATIRKGRWRKGQCSWCRGPVKKPNRMWCVNDICLASFLELQSQVRLCRERAKGKCKVCKKRFAKLEVDHIIPVSQGGLTLLTNLQAICHFCHLIKGAEDRKKYSK